MRSDLPLREKKRQGWKKKYGFLLRERRKRDSGHGRRTKRRTQDPKKAGNPELTQAELRPSATGKQTRGKRDGPFGRKQKSKTEARSG